MRARRARGGGAPSSLAVPDGGRRRPDGRLDPSRAQAESRGAPMDRRVWYVVAAVVVVLLLAWLLGWFGGAEAPVTAPAAPG